MITTINKKGRQGTLIEIIGNKVLIAYNGKKVWGNFRSFDFNPIPLHCRVKSEEVFPVGNWNTAKDFFPEIEIDQKRKEIEIRTFETRGFQKKATITLEWIQIDYSKKFDQAFVRGEVSCQNWGKGYSGNQKFCFAIFEGDSGHIYTHSAPASKGWMEAKPDDIRKRLRKLGIGAETGVLQQGDILLKPANRNAHEDKMFKHERQNIGNHSFEMPVLYHDGQFFVREQTRLKHRATDGIQHPEIIIPPGKWIIGTTTAQLPHNNARD